MARLSLIAAVARNGVIGRDGGMPWKLSTDMRRFRQLTMGKPIVMGRKQWDTVGKPLAGRTNIVVTRDQAFRPVGASVAHSLDDALQMAEEAARSAGGEIMVIGGGEIYAQTIARADRLYITHVEAMPDGDTVFPAIDGTTWTAVSRERHPAGETDSAATEFAVYERLPAREPL